MNFVSMGNPSGDGRNKSLVQFRFEPHWTVLAFDEKRAEVPLYNADRQRFERWCFREYWHERPDKTAPRQKVHAPKATGLRAVDIVAFDPGTAPGTLYLIEVTDYRVAVDTELPEPMSLAHEFAAKLRDTLAALALGRAPTDGACAPFTGPLGSGAQIVFVLHLFWPRYDPLLGLDQVANLHDVVRRCLAPTQVDLQFFTDFEGDRWQVTEQIPEVQQ